MANNKFLPDSDSSKPGKYILYLDAKNLHGASLSQYIPHRDDTQDEVDNFDFSQFSDPSPNGYVLEVDVDYTEHLHDSQNGLPYCPENITPPNFNNPN